MSTPGRGNGNGAADPGPRDDWAELRRLLVDPEQRELAAVKSRLDRLEHVSVEEVSAVLPQAVIHSGRKGRQINEALLPVIEENIGLSIRRNPRPLADALFPVMGPAIRRAVSEALKGLMQQIDAVMEQNLSARGLQWRIEALRTHQPLSRIIFKHTMVYRVEQVFLIHRETGLLLQHAAAGHALVQDPETVSSMLTAIQDFVRDSFKTKQGDTLDEISVGELTVWIEHGPSASIAGVIRGNPPRELRFVFDDALAEIHHDQAESLESFNGNTAPFAATRPQLEACLHFQRDQAEQARQTKRSFSPAYALLALLLAVVGAWTAWHVWTTRHWNGYLARLAQEPGIVVMHAENGWISYGITGLRDPLAADPQQFLGEHGINAASVVSRWQPYESLDPPFVLARAKRLLEPPEGVSLQIEPDGVLTASGVAPAQWITDARRLSRAIPGVARLDDGQMVPAERHELAVLVEKVQGYNILFPEGSAQPLLESRPTVANLGVELNRVLTLAEATGQTAAITLIGHTDGSGTEGLNKSLSQRRADVILSTLPPTLSHGVAISTRGVASTQPFKAETSPEDRASNRRVSIGIGLRGHS